MRVLCAWGQAGDKWVVQWWVTRRTRRHTLGWGPPRLSPGCEDKIPQSCFQLHAIAFQADSLNSDLSRPLQGVSEWTPSLLPSGV